MLQLPSPISNKPAHVGLSPTKFLYLPSERVQLFFREMEYTMARDTTIVACAENLGQFGERKAKLKRSLRELNPLNRGERKDSISTARPL
jgi:hypothetical protein